MSAWRHVRAVGLLPGIVALVVPALLVWRSWPPDVGWGLPRGLGLLPAVLGLALLGAGLLLVVRTVALLATVGRGTLAPWDPTSRLVVRGPYRHVRNPMISGVLLVLLGEAAFLGSLPVLAWFGAVPRRQRRLLPAGGGAGPPPPLRRRLRALPSERPALGAAAPPVGARTEP